ncbi:hypothetical protein [Kitasatospora viridis]|uniref:Uncharacterized protein n=1 Tax=Kitasatospora viridis TaxID=281105 RepID=A0A561TT77_9ACTN|nr:hypothetical protein [Kitasatospora viridis]TWF90319.1 hypothetical protein FHX73_13363 [Kitasatospora viridis]
MRGERGLRLALRLHPARHRREWGEEMAAVFADTTAGAGRWAVARELFDLAGHGLRARTGLGSAGRPAKLAALAAPFAVGALGGFALFALAESLLWPLLHGYPPSWRMLLPPADPFVDRISQVIQTLGRSSPPLFVAALVAALCGRWSAARVLAPLATALMIAGDLTTELSRSHSTTFTVLRGLVAILLVMSPQMFWGTLVLVAPRDLLGPPLRGGGVRAWLMGGVFALGMATGGPVLSGAIWGNRILKSWPALPSAMTLLQACAACALALLLVAPLALRRGWLGPAAAALAGLPFATLDLLILALGRTSDAGTVVLAALGVGAVGAVAVLRRSKSGSKGGRTAAE